MTELTVEVKKLLNSIYFNPNGLPGSFSSLRPLYSIAKSRNSKVTRAQVKLFLQGVKSYIDHKKVRRKFFRRKLLSLAPAEIFARDLIFFSGNLQAKSALNIIDIFSKKAFSRSLRSKKSSEVLEKFKEILEEAKIAPKRLFLDQGSGEYMIF